MNKVKTFAAMAICLIAAVSCKTQYDTLLEGNDTDAKYKAAFDYFEKGKYDKASQLFESISIVTSGTERDDTVQYYWGLCNYSAQDYITAETNFENFLNNYPRSTFAEAAEFLHVDCLYKATLRYELDQTPTYKAMTAISEYLMNHPTGANAQVCRKMLQDLDERLDRKAYESARLYYTMEDYLAARVAFKNVLKDDADNIYREDILYYTAMSSYNYALLSVKSKQKERYLVFMDDYLNFIGEYPESGYVKQLQALYDRVKDK